MVKTWWDEYQEAHSDSTGKPKTTSFEEETPELMIKLHGDPKRIFVIVPSSVSATTGSFIPTFPASFQAESIDALHSDGFAHIVYVKPISRKEKFPAFQSKIRKAFDRAQMLSAQHNELPITILAEEIGVNFLLKTVAKLPSYFLENAFDSLILYNPVISDLKLDRRKNAPLPMSQQTIVNTFDARFGKLIDIETFAIVKHLKLPVLLLTNNIYEEVHGLAFRNAGQYFFDGTEKENLHRVHINTDSISGLLESQNEDVDFEFGIVVNTWNEIVVNKILLFVNFVEETYSF